VVDRRTLEEFEKFWTMFPYRVNKPNAMKAFAKARTRATWAVIHLGLTRAMESAEWHQVDREGLRFIPHPATWLNQNGWENQYHPRGDQGGWLKAFLAKGKQAG
jgi:hypothetical protein